jgi:hypothetical protein
LICLAIQNGWECTCVTAYLDTATGRVPCNPQHCEYSSCAVIKNNYNALTKTFRAPPLIRRSDGTDALRQSKPRVYTAPFQITHQDQEKFQKGISKAQPQTVDEDFQSEEVEKGQWQPNQFYNPSSEMISVKI